ncbi:polysaccharide deacetylase family protein [Alteromonas halophila]|nr:polysaccharide deacetylase family protein [Alteromonas halophila]
MSLRKGLASASMLGLLAVSAYCPAIRAAEPVTFVSLSYDDALESQLVNAVPALERVDFNASFYLVPSYPGFSQFRDQWASLPELGQELGNHSFTHPCRGSLNGREWVAPDNDLDALSVKEMQQQVISANHALRALDNTQTRTYTLPCGDTRAAGHNYLSAISPYVYAIKGHTLASQNEIIIAPAGETGAELIALLKAQPDSVRIINIIFHGIGGDYLSVSSQAHQALLTYLDANRHRYHVNTYLNIVRQIRKSDEGAPESPSAQ